MQGTAATPGILLLLGGAAVTYWAVFTPDGLLAKFANPLPVYGSSPQPPTTGGDGSPAPGPGGDGSNPDPKKGDALRRFLTGIAPPSPELGTTTYAQQKKAFMDAIAGVEGGPNSVNAKTGAYGRYQILPRTWDAWSRHYFGYVLPKTPTNADLIAGKRIDSYYQSYQSKINSGQLPNTISPWTRIAVSWNMGPSVGKRSDWHDWGQHGYLYATNVIWRMANNLGGSVYP